ncbi:hypothetical protein Pmani_020767 [Petrolisthes manimaculis]|uniref:Uncharacterized protein n=1 Tax=Petrolisthes manimaculis TaxID=1843537 RepID=A0AAE1PG36_9EUCA|nr:hypothetical protein Pmani_020767 [Petrolisthes manimaculis]
MLSDETEVAKICIKQPEDVKVKTEEASVLHVVSQAAPRHSLVINASHLIINFSKLRHILASIKRQSVNKVSQVLSQVGKTWPV